jgi:hypothetical protein
MTGPRTAILLAVTLASCAHPPSAPATGPLDALEARWQMLRYWDDQRRLIESRGANATLDGIPSRAAEESLTVWRGRVAVMLRTPEVASLPELDQTALDAMREGWRAALSGDSTRSDTQTAAGRLTALGDSVLAAYGRAASRVVVEGDTLNRLAILGLLSRTDDSARRERLFLALEPTWQSVNGDGLPGSPYRRLLTLRHEAWGDTASPIDRKGPAFGLSTPVLEQWLVTALERWRAGQPDSLVEPWDWYYLTGEASRRLSPRIPTIHDIQRVNNAFYRGFGADPLRLRVRYDLSARPGKYPVAFTDFGVRNRWVDGRFVPGEPWVFTSYLGGGLDNLAELLHESGHAIHIAAIRTRPAFMDWPDNDTFTEALADLPAMEMYEPAWQRRFLGDSAPLAASFRAKYAGIMLDVAWALFEIRVHRDPAADPNLVWTGITRDYLRIRPHPDWSWWAMRGQLLDAPGYLVNYAMGAFVVADLRATIRGQRGPAAWQEPGMYSWLIERLYRFGLERSGRAVLEDLLGRPLRPDALLEDLGRIRP